MKRELSVIFENVEVSGDTTVIQSPSLLAALAEQHEKQLESLSAIAGAPVTEADIRIDDQGRVIILHDAFSAAIAQLPGGGAGYRSNNNYCQNAFCGDWPPPPPTNTFCGSGGPPQNGLC